MHRPNHTCDRTLAEIAVETWLLFAWVLLGDVMSILALNLHKTPH